MYCPVCLTLKCPVTDKFQRSSDDFTWPGATSRFRLPADNMSPCSLGHCHSRGLCPKESELVFPSQGFYPNHLRAEGGQRWNSHQFKDSRREGRGVAPRCQSPGTKLPLQVLISGFFLLCGNPHSGEGWKRPREKLHKKK